MLCLQPVTATELMCDLIEVLNVTLKLRPIGNAWKWKSAAAEMLNYIVKSRRHQLLITVYAN